MGMFPVPTYNVVTLAFTNGGLYNGGNTVVAGDTVRETGGTVYGVVMQVTTTSGTWAAGTAAGTIVLMTTQTWTASQYFDDFVAGTTRRILPQLRPRSRLPTRPESSRGRTARPTHQLPH